VRRQLGWIAIVWLVLLCAVAVLTYGGRTSRQSLDARTQAVASGFRCLVCQGESVAESPSGFARNVRALIRRQLKDGRSPDQIRSYLVSRYTESILLEPPASGLGNLAWLAPPLLLLGGLGLLATLVYDWRRRGRDTAVSGRRAAYLARVRADLAAEGE
jgi:cytochrome c-type biogenesis protein CcmH